MKETFSSCWFTLGGNILSLYLPGFPMLFGHSKLKSKAKLSPVLILTLAFSSLPSMILFGGPFCKKQLIKTRMHPPPDSWLSCSLGLSVSPSCDMGWEQQPPWRGGLVGQGMAELSVCGYMVGPVNQWSIKQAWLEVILVLIQID